MKTDKLVQGVIACLMIMLAGWPGLARSAYEIPISQQPLAIASEALPKVMLAMSRDHSVYSKAYADYTDLNKDGVIDSTYNNNIEYYGYFDSKKCYKYDNNRFEPKELATSHQCDEEWSGNFLNWAAMTPMDIIRKTLFGGFRSTDTKSTSNSTNSLGVTVLERVLIPFDAHAFAKVYSNDDVEKYTPYSSDSITLCNFTNGTGLAKSVNTSSKPPLVRVAEGSWPLWASQSGIQCQWGDGSALPESGSGNKDYNVRVKVCVKGMEESNCTSYLSDSKIETLKPTGLLQKYWVTVRGFGIGLVSGSWAKNKAGGVLRTPPSNESSGQVDAQTGVFSSTGLYINSVIPTLSRFRISDYNFSTRQYALNASTGEYVDWGNPISEIYLETLRFFLGKSDPTSEFDAHDSDLQLNKVSWPLTPPINESNWCANNSIVAISTGNNSFDTDQLSNDLGIDANAKTDNVGTEEALSGRYLIGSSTAGVGSGPDNNKECTGKTLTKLSDAQGICPQAPQQAGGYQIAGLAYYGRTTDLFTTETVNPLLAEDVRFKGKQIISTYSVALSENSSRFEIPLNGSTVKLTPACKANVSAAAAADASGWTPCSITDIRVQELHYNDNKQLDRGSFDVTWEDAEAGSDYDMDGIERLAFCVGSACSPAVDSDKLQVTTSVLQTATAKAMQFGFWVIGSDDENMQLPLLCTGGVSCNSTVTSPPLFSKGSSTTKLLESPLWYVAKYGGFSTVDTSKDDKPSAQVWDENGDGLPDAYFQVDNAGLLEDALDTSLNKISSQLASSASVAANSTRLDTTAALYQAKFNPGAWTGQLVAYAVDTLTGRIDTVPSWEAGELLTARDVATRTITSLNDSTKLGIDFAYNNLSSAQKALLSSDQLDYIRGVRTKEQPNGALRKRFGVDGLLGDIVNSDPEFINTISQGYDTLPGGGAETASYLDFISSPAYTSRPPMLAVGANDGMLHVFDASIGTAKSGQEVMAYVPATLMGQLKNFTLPTYVSKGKHQYFVDGTPNVGDVYIDTDNDGDKEWRTALVGTLGGGGRGVFALDLTLLNPNNYKTKETFSASRVLWEISTTFAPKATDLTDSGSRYGYANHLGHVFGQASVVRMANGKYAAVFGNGYNSVRQDAVLYIVDIDTGELIRSIATGVGDNTGSLTVNGLSAPITVDANGDRIVDAVYAGDYRGNLWKFDVSASNPSNWKVAYTSGGSPAPLYITESHSFSTLLLTAEEASPVSQTITAKPQFSLHPNGGVMIYFGTGKYFERLDTLNNDDIAMHSFYGLWDSCVNFAGVAASCGDAELDEDESAKLTKSRLVQQTIDAETTSVRVTSSNPVDYSKETPDQGWYIDLYKDTRPETGEKNVFIGERVVSQALFINGRLFFSTLYNNDETCFAGGSSWLMGLDALTGKRLEDAVFLSDSGETKIAKTHTIGDRAYNVSGVRSTVGISDTPAHIDTDGDSDSLVSSGSTSQTEVHAISKVSGKRLSWTQIR